MSNEKQCSQTLATFLYRLNDETLCLQILLVIDQVVEDQLVGE